VQPSPPGGLFYLIQFKEVSPPSPPQQHSNFIIISTYSDFFSKISWNKKFDAELYAAIASLKKRW
jgi:hypothetical protein